MEGEQQYDNQMMEEVEELDIDNIVFRRADPDDTDAIINLVEIGEDDIYNRVYSYPKVLKLIETAYLAITAIDGDGNVVGFAAFEDYPQGMRGMVDDKHHNYWEDWFHRAYDIKEFASFNTLWLTYFIAGGVIQIDTQHMIFKQMLQTVYTSAPDLIGILFLVRGDADEDDIHHCFDPLAQFFERLTLKDKTVMQNVRGVHRDSEVFFSSRVHVVPFIEVRQAKQEDHDDLADVFNAQSETVTEAYGEYFIAELIASQNEKNKALVAQVKDKAVGLMGLTRNVDLKLLHECFELDPYDNLLKPEMMDAVRARRDHIREQMHLEEENTQIAKLRKLKEETMRCNIVAQRIEFQEHLVQNWDEIEKILDKWTNNPDEDAVKDLDRALVENEVFPEMLSLGNKGGFKVYQPSDYFLENDHYDKEICCNVMTEQEFMISTLEMFGLCQGYMDRKGHFPNWEKEQGEKRNRGKGKKKAAPAAKKGGGGKLQARREQAARDKGKIQEKPTHFDLDPLRQAFKRFKDVDSQVRAELRTNLIDFHDRVKDIFKDENNEHSFKKCVAVPELEPKLQAAGLQVEALQGSLGAVFRCFGTIETEQCWGLRQPPETEEQKKAKTVLQIELAKQEKANKEKDKKEVEKPMTEEELAAQIADEEARAEKIKLNQEIIKPKPPQLYLLDLTSLRDLVEAVERMAEYDRLMTELGVAETDFTQEDAALKRVGRPYVKELQPKDQVAEHIEYSEDPEIQQLVEKIGDLESIPEPPEWTKNAFAITLFCMETAFDCRSVDLLKHAFDLYPDRDYLIVTMPHTIPENALLAKFNLVAKKAANTFSHVLYIFHKDFLYEQDLSLTRTVEADFAGIRELVYSSGSEQEGFEAAYAQTVDAAQSADSPWVSFTARVQGQPIATFIISKDVNLDYYVSHFHVQDQILMGEHDRKSHTRLVYAVINPVFEKSTQFMLKEVLRLSGKSCMYFEIKDQTVIPTIFHQFVHIRARRFPHFLDRKWDHERYDPKKKDQMDLEEEYGDGEAAVDGAERDPLDEEEPPFALCFLTKRLLSEPKIVKNSRIVVVGASDTGISFIEALLSIGYLNFTNITLVAPGGLPHHHIPEKKTNLKAYSTSYTSEELKKLMLESRVRVLDARMVDIDRSDKNIILNDGNVIPYDNLVLAMGIQDKTLDSLNYASHGVEKSEGISTVQRAKGVLSIDDPYLYRYLQAGSSLMQALTDRRRQTRCVVYGRSLHAYCLIQGLLERGVRPQNIVLAVPRIYCHVNDDEDTMVEQDIPTIYPEAYDDEEIKAKIETMLENKGIEIIREAKLIEIITDKDRERENNKGGSQPNSGKEGDVDTSAYQVASLEKVVFKRLDIPDNEEEEEAEVSMDASNHASEMDASEKGDMDGGDSDDDDNKQEDGEGEQHEKKKKRKRNEQEMDCGVLITCGHKDVDTDVFQSIHSNGLVYNGRLIVDKTFKTTDPSVFAAGSLCEFSNRYLAMAQGRPLRMDRYNGREMGSRLARSIFDIYDPKAGFNGEEQGEELPLFFLPQGQGGVLPNNIIYYYIKTTNPLLLQPNVPEAPNRKDLVCDNLDADTGKGHFIKFTFNSIGLIDSVTYMGHEEVVLQSLWSFVGLHENYLNQLTERFENGIIPNAAEFLSENWAIALYHEWFGDFCLRMRQGIQGLEDIQHLVAKAFEMTKHGQGLDRKAIADLSKGLDPKTVKMIEDETLEFVKTNMNHLPMYYVPGEEFP